MRAVIVLTLAATGCPTVELGSTPSDVNACRPDRGYFDATIWPGYIVQTDEPAKSCVPTGACHSPGGSGGTVEFRPDPIDPAVNYQMATGSRLNCGDPEASPFLEKPLELVPHGGGRIFEPTDPEVAIFLGWF